MCDASPPKAPETKKQPLRILLSREQYDQRGTSGGTSGGARRRSGGAPASPAAGLFNPALLDPRAGLVPGPTPGVNLG